MTDKTERGRESWAPIKTGNFDTVQFCKAAQTAQILFQAFWSTTTVVVVRHRYYLASIFSYRRNLPCNLFLRDIGVNTSLANYSNSVLLSKLRKYGPIPYRNHNTIGWLFRFLLRGQNHLIKCVSYDITPTVSTVLYFFILQTCYNYQETQTSTVLIYKEGRTSHHIGIHSNISMHLSPISLAFAYHICNTLSNYQGLSSLWNIHPPFIVLCIILSLHVVAPCL